MVPMAEVAEFVDDRVLQHSLGCEDQVPVQVHDPVGSTTAPEVLLVLYPDSLGFEAIGVPVLADEDAHVFAEP